MSYAKYSGFGGGGGISTLTLSGDVTGTLSGTNIATTLSPNVVTNAKLAQMPANTIKGNNTGSTANAMDLTVAQVNTMLGTVTTLAAVGAAPNANGAVISGNTLTLEPADGTHPGLLTAIAQTIGGAKTFSSTISASNLSGTNTGDQTITLTGDVTGSGTGSFATTIASVGGSTAASIHTSQLLTAAATSANTASTLVLRDGSGNFSAGTITASLTGTASGNANLTLSNLTNPTAINQALVFGVTPGIISGMTTTGGVSGDLTINTTAPTAGSSAGSITIVSADGAGGSTGASLVLPGGLSTSFGFANPVTLTSGSGEAGAGNHGGDINITSGNGNASSGSNGGNIHVVAGSGNPQGTFTVSSSNFNLDLSGNISSISSITATNFSITTAGTLTAANFVLAPDGGTISGAPQVGGASGSIVIQTTTPASTFAAGDITLQTAASSGGTTGSSLFLPGATAAAFGFANPVALTSGNGDPSGAGNHGGDINITSGNGNGSGGSNGGNINIVTGSGNPFGNIILTAPIIKVTGNISTQVAGNGLQIKGGSNARIGSGTLTGGTVTISNTSVTANSRIFVQDNTSGSLTNVGSMVVSAVSAGTSFTVKSTNPLDTSTFWYFIVEET